MEENNKKIRSIKIADINFLLMILAFLLCLAVFLTTINTKKNSSILIQSMNDYAECNKALNSFREASDYLTNQIRLFAINLDPAYMEGYFEEINILRTRESNLEVLEMTHKGDEVDNYTLRALETSNSLAESENYYFRLLCESIDYPYDKMPFQIKNIELRDEHKNLSKSSMESVSRDFLFDVDYLKVKAQIINYVDKALSALIKSYLVTQEKNKKVLNNSIVVQHISVIFLFLVSIVLFLLLIIFVIQPLKTSLRAIEKGKKIKFHGSYEMQYIQYAYNELIEKNEIRTSVLQYKAEHDPLTGLINREAFEQLKEVMKKEIEPIAYLIIDIDFFKNINDSYGHGTGDEVLVYISKLLLEQFSESDYVARIGGDEFSIIMTNLDHSPEKFIQDKIKTLNKILQNPDRDIPPVSLSVGVAISESGFTESMEKHADIALYRVKNGGRCNCSFY